MRIAVLAAAVSLSIIGLSQAGDARAAMRLHTNIPPENLATALKSFAQGRNLQILYFSDAVRDVHTGGAVGQLTTDEALTQLLSGTGLTFRYVSDKAITILPASAAPAAAGSSAPASPGSGPPTTSADQQEGKTSSSGAFLLAQATSGQAQGPTSVASRANSEVKSEVLQEVIVTAQKREERLQDVPVPVTVLQASSLIESNQVRLQDYFTSVPGLNLMPQASLSTQVLSIRGITSGVVSNPTVGVTVDDVPYGATTALESGGGALLPDLDPADLARIEVLRGPQGTLYGAASLGGLLKFVTVDPSTDGFTGRVQAGLESVHGSSEVGYGARGSVNIPLSDTFAIRASAFTRQDPGYVDNLESGQHDVNEQRVDGGRLSALWKPSDTVSLKLSALIQDDRSNGFSDSDLGLGLGDFQQMYLPGTGASDRKFQAYSAILSAKLGTATLTAISGYNINQYSDSYDLTYILGPVTELVFPGIQGTSAPEQNKTSKFSQEVRLAVPFGSQVDWLIGGFYTHEHAQYAQQLLAVDGTGAAVGVDQTIFFVTNYTEYAAFSDLTVRFTDRFDIQIGGRESHINQDVNEVETGPFDPIFALGPSPVVVPEVNSSATAATYLVTPRLRLSPDFMLYARLASGYRPGGPNIILLVANLPNEYKPDRTLNYELGAKGDFLDHRLSLDASLYYIDWKDLQLNLVDPATSAGYIGNASRAKSQGLEVSLESRPVSGLTLSGWVAWDDAVLTEPFPPGVFGVSEYGAVGDRLPYSPRFSANASAREDFPVGNDLNGFVQAAVSYIGDRVGEFTQTPQRQDLPAYTKIDVSAGVKTGSWNAELFVNNLADKRGILNGGMGQFPPFAFTFIQPRTVGISVSKTF